MVQQELFPRPEILIGQSAPDVVRFLVRKNPRIKGFSLVRYTPGTTSEEEPDLFWNYDRELREATGANFDYVVGLEPYGNTEIGVTSLVEVVKAADSKPDVYDLRHEFAHIPMVDFYLPGRTQYEAVAQIKGFLSLLNKELRGWIADSGAGSYHFYGSGLMNLDEYSKFVGLLRYDAERGRIVNRQFARKAFEPNYFSGGCYMTLRIAPSHRHPNIPTVVDIV